MDGLLQDQAFEGVKNVAVDDAGKPKAVEFQYGGKIYLFQPEERRVLPKDVAEFLVHKSVSFRSGKAALEVCDLADAIADEKEKKARAGDAAKAVRAGMVAPEDLQQLGRALKAEVAQDLNKELQALEVRLEARMTDKIGAALTKVMVKLIDESAKPEAAKVAKEAIAAAVDGIVAEAKASVPDLAKEAVEKTVDGLLKQAQASDLHKGVIERVVAEKLPGVVDKSLAGVVKAQIEEKLKPPVKEAKEK